MSRWWAESRPTDHLRQPGLHGPPYYSCKSNGYVFELDPSRSRQNAILHTHTQDIAVLSVIDDPCEGHDLPNQATLCRFDKIARSF